MRKLSFVLALAIGIAAGALVNHHTRDAVAAQAYQGANVTNATGVLSPANGGTGKANNAAATLTRSGNHALTFTTTGTTGVTLPTSGTLARVSGETFVTPNIGAATGNSIGITSGSYWINSNNSTFGFTAGSLADVWMTRSAAGIWNVGETAGAATGGVNLTNLQVKSQQLQGFQLIIERTAGGVLQHTIRSGSAGSTNFASKITGSSATATTTPTGADASTAFAGGGKISSALNYNFILNTASQTQADMLCLASVGVNWTGTPATAQAAFRSVNVNGVTRTYLTVDVLNAATGAGINLTTLVNDTGLFVNFLCHLA